MEIQWKDVRRVLIVRLRSIGDTVLTTPTLRVLRENLPAARIDILLEEWVAPVLDGLEDLDNVIVVSKSTRGRIRTALELRKTRYDVVFNLHGGTTAAFITRATGAPHRIGFRGFQFSFLYNHAYPSPAEFWQKQVVHSAERQIALVGFAGLPFDHCPRTRLNVSASALESVNSKLSGIFAGRIPERIALIHPAAAFDTKRWSEKNFALLTNHFAGLGFVPLIITAADEKWIVDRISECLEQNVNALTGLTLPEVSALASVAGCFVGNDSGIAHIAAAVGTPTIVIFGSSDVDNWRPFTDAPNGVVRNRLECQPCPGDKCRVFGKPKCITEIAPAQVYAEIDRVLGSKTI